MKLIGIDYGKRRVGLAVTDETGEFIRSLPTIDRNNKPDLIQTLCEIIRQEAPSTLVIGLPLDQNDADTPMSREIRSFAGHLCKKISLPVHFIDESLTSVRSNYIIRNRNNKYRRGKENIDRISACLILEAFQKEQK
jgi:putative Holliday junction resolvase